MQYLKHHELKVLRYSVIKKTENAEIK